MLSDEITEKLINRNKNIPALLLHRSVEYANNNTELFDILTDLELLVKKENFPIIWDDSVRKWTKVRDIFQYKDPRKST